MEFLNHESLNERRDKTQSVLNSIKTHIECLKDEKVNIKNISDDYLIDVEANNLFALETIVSENLKRTDISENDQLRLHKYKTRAIFGCKDFDSAKDSALQALELARQFQNRHYIWSSLLDLSLITKSQGDLLKARDYLDEASALALDKMEQQKTEMMKGNLMLAKGMLNDAIENVFKPLLTVIEDVYLKGEVLQKLGNAYRSAANWGAAKECLRKSIDIADELKMNVEKYERHGDLGNVYRSEGRIKDALEHQWFHMNFSLNRGDLASLAIACFNIGFANYSLKPEPNLNNAVIFTLLHNILSKETKNKPHHGISLNNLGKIFMAMKFYEPSLDVLLNCIEIAKQTGNKGGEGMAYGNLGSAHRALRAYDDAIKYHKIYRENAKLRGDDGGMGIMQRELALDYILKGDLDSAKNEILDSIMTNEQIRSKLGPEDSSKLANFEKNQAAAFNLLILILVRQGRYEEALAFSELARARALTDCIGKLQDEESKDETWIWKEHHNKALTDNTVKEIIKNYQKVAEQLSITFVSYFMITEFDEKGNEQKWMYIWVINSGVSTINFEKVKIGDSTRPNGIYLDENFFNNITRSFSISEENLVVTGEDTCELETNLISGCDFKLKDQTVKVIEELKKMNFQDQEDQNLDEVCDSLQHKLKDLANLPESGERSARVSTKKILNNDSNKKFRILFEICIAPIEKYLPPSGKCGAEPRLVIIPQDFLFNVPFCALLSENGQYLVQKYIISYTPSLRALLLLQLTQSKLRKRQDDHLKVLSIGNPLMPFAQIPQIKHAEKEAKMVCDIYENKNTTLLLHKDATKNKVVCEMREADILHVASHAYPKDVMQKEENCDYTMRGCILLSKSDEHCSGLLNAYEIEKNRNNLQLVMLSCCETGLGKVTDDGIIGLYRSFLASGSTVVTVTLWKIQDDITPIIMKRFYEEYKTSRDAAKSLRASMIEACVERRLPPEQWAAFSVVGACCEEVTLTN